MKCKTCELSTMNINTEKELPIDTFYMCRSCKDNCTNGKGKYYGSGSYYRQSIGKKTDNKEV